MSNGNSTASFRDPSGFLFRRDGILFRQINRAYCDDYQLLMQSGLYERLTRAGLLIPHTETEVPPAEIEGAFKIIQPEPITFISYPYEWSFSQLQDAALITLRIQKRALAAGMSLKDASAYNIQFHQGRPLLIDTLSFETYLEGKPWVAYRQFCQQFLAPLALMARTDIRLSQLARVYIDGVPLDLASKLLPFFSRANFGLLSHVHLHASAQLRYAGRSTAPKPPTRSIGKPAMLALVDNLANTVRKLSWKPAGTEWGDYYSGTNYSDPALQHKKSLVSQWVSRVRPASVWDLGANTGLFTRLASAQGIPSIAFDIDPAAVERNYLEIKAAKEQNLLPLVLDLTNPSSSLGWANSERESLLGRGPADMILALALIHHLAISNNVPLQQLAAFLADLGTWLIIEFVPKQDSQVQRLLATRTDIFDQYHQAGFEAAFRTRFVTHQVVPIHESQRHLYLMRRMEARLDGASASERTSARALAAASPGVQL
jgi:ribosomal protein L11 methylase PrmA